MMRAMAMTPRDALPIALDDPEPESISCGRCRRGYTRNAWARLPKVRTLTPDEVHRHVIDWRDERVIEVRAYAACGRGMARMVPNSR